MKIILADPPALERAYDASYPNLGLLYIASYTKRAVENRSEIEYLGPRYDLKSHVAYVKQKKPEIYGISFTSKTASLAYETIHAVRQNCPDVLIVSGGPHVTAMPNEVMESSETDIAVIGEGEITFSEIVKSYSGKNKNNYSSINGILFRANDQIQRTKPRAFVTDLDDLPMPAWDLIDFSDYKGMHLKKQPIESSLLISRGCPFDCAFCSNPVWKSAKPWLRHRSVEAICEEIKYLYNRGVREIYMSSDELNFNESWAQELCRAIFNLNYRDLYFQCNMRVDKVSEELTDLLNKINCWLVHIGVESANDRVLKGIGKHITVEQVERAARLFRKSNVNVFAFTMLYNVWEEDGKLCWETNEEVDNTIRFMKKLFNQKLIQYMSWQFCTPMPGSRLYRIAERHGLFRGDPRVVWEHFDEHTVAMKIPGVSEKQMKWKIKKGILLKDWFMVRSGNISLKHLWRVKENLRALIK
ncbi:MAG: radical SAM protein [Desulfobacterales bacterium]